MGGIWGEIGSWDWAGWRLTTRLWCWPLGGKVGSPASSVQRDIANSALLSLDQHPDESNPEQDTRQQLESERQGAVGWGGVK